MTARAGLDWRERAACRGKTGLFFPSEHDAVAPAKAICRSCPVYGPCRAETLATMPEHGVWAGMTRDERSKAARRGAA